MNYQFTSAAERVLQHATGWIDSSTGCVIDARTLLLGLLAESECHAACLLAKHDVSMQAACDKWAAPDNFCRQVDNPPIPSLLYHKDLNRSLCEVYRLASEFEQSPTLATEHLLLAILCGTSDAAHWLTQRGITRQLLEDDLRTRNGYVNTPIEIAAWEEEGGREDKGGRGKAGGGEADNDSCSICNLQSPPPPPPPPFPLPPYSTALFRILDAAANRAREGLRVVEDYLRFVLDDRFLTETAKQLRHDLVSAIKKIPADHLLASRETQADVGTALTSAAEATRADFSSVLAANFGRLSESLRSLEEFGKLLDPAMAAAFKQIRYRHYTLHRAVEITRHSSERLANAKLYVLLDGHESPDAFRTFAATLISAGVHVLQLRDKKLDDRQLLERARILRELISGAPSSTSSLGSPGSSAIGVPQAHEARKETTDASCSLAGATASLSSSASSPGSPDSSAIGVPKAQEASDETTDSSCDCAAPIDKLSGPPVSIQHRPLFIMNDRPDLAVLAQADGVHLGQEELSVKDARRIVGPEMLIGVSTHSIKQARQAVLDGANYIGVGPTFPSTTKNFETFPGLDLLRAVATEIRLPAFAIGGITLENLPQVLATGIQRVAMSGAITGIENPENSVHEFLKML